jgi:hypothetical protein
MIPLVPIAKVTPVEVFRNRRRSIFLPMSHLLGGALDCRDDLLVGAAAAEVGVHVSDNLFPARILVPFQQCGGFHDLAGLTVTALRDLFFDPGLLQWVAQVIGETFYSRDVFAFDRKNGSHTGKSRLAVNVHGTRAALRDAAAKLRARQLEVLTNYP